MPTWCWTFCWTENRIPRGAQRFGRPLRWGLPRACWLRTPSRPSTIWFKRSSVPRGPSEPFPRSCECSTLPLLTGRSCKKPALVIARLRSFGDGGRGSVCRLRIHCDTRPQRVPPISDPAPDTGGVPAHGQSGISRRGGWNAVADSARHQRIAALLGSIDGDNSGRDHAGVAHQVAGHLRENRLRRTSDGAGNRS